MEICISQNVNALKLHQEEILGENIRRLGFQMQFFLGCLLVCLIHLSAPLSSVISGMGRNFVKNDRSLHLLVRDKIAGSLKGATTTAFLQSGGIMKSGLELFRL